MSRHRGVGVLVLVALTMVGAVVVPRAPEALAEVEMFRVKRIQLEGARYLTLEEVREKMAVPDEASVWDDVEPMEARVRALELVREARVRRRLPSTLLVEISEREPVAFLPTPVVRPVDREGRLLPVDPARHRLDLPILLPRVDAPEGAGELTPSQIRLLAGEVERLGETEPGTLASVSEVAADAAGDVLIRLTDPAVTLRYRPPLSPGRLREALRVLDDSRERRPDRPPFVVDLRYDDQVVVRLRPSTTP